MIYQLWPKSSTSGAVHTKSGAFFLLFTKLMGKQLPHKTKLIFDLFRWAPAGIISHRFVRPCYWSNLVSSLNWGSKLVPAGCYLATFKAQWPSWSLNNIVLALLSTENSSWSMGCWHRCASGFRRWKWQIVIWPNQKLMTFGILRCCAWSRFSIFEAMAVAWWLVCAQDLVALYESEGFSSYTPGVSNMWWKYRGMILPQTTTGKISL